ncbi:MAG: hypothetical protein AB1500_12850 [Bacillota bacterium]
MRSQKKRMIGCTVLLLLSLVVCAPAFSADPEEVDVRLRPDTLIVNSTETANWPHFKAIVGYYLVGYKITGYEIGLYQGDVLVAWAESFRPTWYNCEATFDREAVQQYALDNGISGRTSFTVKGWFTAVSSTNSIAKVFTGSDEVLILVQGKQE